MNGWNRALLITLFVASVARGQWSADPESNLSIADGPGDQVQPKVRALPDGSFYVSWFSNNPKDPPPSGYDVYLQLLDPDGFEQFPHNGVLIADLGNSSTQDYGLDADAERNALLAFLDTREGAAQQVTATKVSPSGKQLWGEMGVQLTGDAIFHGNPKIAATSEGNAVVGWVSGSATALQKLDPDGQALWGDGIVLSEAGANYAIADLHPGEDGTVIVSWIRDTGFASQRWLLTNKLDADGQLLWGEEHVRVFDGGSLQLGNFPYFKTDGAGGAVFAWYSSYPSLQVFAQHISSDGAELFPHNGSPGSIDGARIRVSPSASYQAETGETFFFWTEQNALQSMSGVFGQKLDLAGQRQWGDTGLEIVPLGSDQQLFTQTLASGGGAWVFWVDELRFASDTLLAVHLDGDGAIDCSIFPVSCPPATKSRLAASLSPSEVAAVAWQDSRSGTLDVFVQNVNPNCTLGPAGNSRR